MVLQPCVCMKLVSGCVCLCTEMMEKEGLGFISPLMESDWGGGGGRPQTAACQTTTECKGHPRTPGYQSDPGEGRLTQVYLSMRAVVQTFEVK